MPRSFCDFILDIRNNMSLQKAFPGCGKLGNFLRVSVEGSRDQEESKCKAAFGNGVEAPTGSGCWLQVLDTIGHFAPVFTGAPDADQLLTMVCEKYRLP